MSRDDARRTLIAYDITDDRRRDRLVKTLQRYGERVQYSVFVVDCRGAKLRRLQDEVLDIIISQYDSVLYCDLGLVSRIDDSVFSFAGKSRPLIGDIVIL